MIQAETLELLEWPRLCQHLATFSATKLGAIAAQNLPIPKTREQSQQLLEYTSEVYALETQTALNFQGISDIGEALLRAELQGLLSAGELLAIATTLGGMRRLRRQIDEQQEATNLKALVSPVRTYPELEQQIYHCIDESGAVLDRASPRLGEIRQAIKGLRHRIEQILQTIIQRHSQALGQAVITQRNDRYVLNVKATHREAIPGIIHDTSSSGASLYIEPQAVLNLGNQLRQWQRQEQTEIEVILRSLTDRVAAVKPDLEELLAIATSLDLATAKARYSRWLEASPPQITTDTLQLRKLRHPLLIWQQRQEQGAEVVPVDLQIPVLVRVVAITGPNTGGKTVTLKALGITALMAKVGLFVPAQNPEVPWFDQVLADIGDEQSLQQSLSTFSGHIRRIGRILDAIKSLGDEDHPELLNQDSQDNTPNFDCPLRKIRPCLVLLDEVGAGTDPAEGSALAIALLRYLADRIQLTVATTHYGELKALKYQDQRFENASVEFDDQTLTPTYRLLWGIPGRSNALNIAQRLGLPREIIQQASSSLGSDRDDINQVIVGLEGQRRQQEEKAQAAAQLLAQAEQLHRELQDQAALLNQREQMLRQQQEQAIQAAIAQAKGEIASVIRNLQQASNPAQEAHRASQALGEIQNRYSLQPAPAPVGFCPQPGDRVRVNQLGQAAEVLSVNAESQQLTVRFGLMKVTVSFADVESLSGEKIAPPPKPKTPDTRSSSLSYPTVRTESNTIDLRGSRISEAEQRLDQMLANRAGGTVWIIHGKGTGKLRRGIHEFLQNHPQIGGFTVATDADGGAGVTIAHLK